MASSSDDSVTHWIQQLHTDRQTASEKVWGWYESRLLALAARKLSLAARAVSEPEDVVVSVFESFFERAAAGQIPADAHRDDLWRLLAKMVQFKAISHARRELRQKRGGGHRIDAIQGEQDFIAEATTPELSPAMAAEVSDSIEALVGLLDSQQREIVALKLEGAGNAEIATRLDVSVPTIERRLRLIRKHWQKWLDEQ